MRKIYVITRGKKKVGPFNINEIYKLAGMKKINANTVLWIRGMKEGKKAEALIPHLFKEGCLPQNRRKHTHWSVERIVKLADQIHVDNWGGSILALLFYTSCAVLAGFVPFLLLGLIGPLVFAAKSFFLKIVRKGDSDFAQIFSGFLHFVPSFNLSIFVAFVIISGAGILAGPGALLIYLGTNSISIVSRLMTLGGILLIIGGFIIMSFLALSFSMSVFSLADNPSLNPIPALKKSWKLMAGNKRNLIKLNLHLIRYWLLIICTFGVASIFLSPRLILAHVLFYENLVRSNE